jgi:GNAT superfamily N-acetyltransferase
VNAGRTATATTIRAATAADRPHIFDLMRASIGWDDDPRLAALFAWKHDTNPFGPSPAWVAVAGDRIVGFRTFMRWEFVLDGQIVRAVRAVDTATHPDYQGRGIFRELTLTGLDALQAEGVDMVFNTPNDQSRPGYLKMGWHVVGRLPLVMRPSRLSRVARLRGARVPAERWSIPTSMGEPPRFPAQAIGVDAGALATNRRDAYLEWRYSLEPLAYRVLALEDDADAGVRWRPRSRSCSPPVSHNAASCCARSRGSTVSTTPPRCPVTRWPTVPFPCGGSVRSSRRGRSAGSRSRRWRNGSSRSATSSFSSGVTRKSVGISASAGRRSQGRSVESHA